MNLRIATWNMNERERSGSHADAWTFLLDTVKPDIALIQEAVPPSNSDDRFKVRFAQAWPHEDWGSAVLTRSFPVDDGWQDSSRGAVVAADFEIPGLSELTSIVSLHARVPDDGSGVITPLRQTFDVLRPRLEARFIVGGDFNTARAAAKAWPAYGHGEFWRDVEAWGFKEPLQDGQERQSYWGRWLKNKLPSIGNSLQDDHILVDSQTFELVRRVVVWDTRQVRQLSDHAPIVVDLSLPDSPSSRDLM